MLFSLEELSLSTKSIWGYKSILKILGGPSPHPTPEKGKKKGSQHGFSTNKDDPKCKLAAWLQFLINNKRNSRRT